MPGGDSKKPAPSIPATVVSSKNPASRNILRKEKEGDKKGGGGGRKGDWNEIIR